MKAEWAKVQLQESVSILGDGLHGTPRYDENGDYRFISGNNLKDGQTVFNEKARRASRDQFLKYKKDLTCRTLLVSIDGTIGNVAYYNNEKVVLGKIACDFNIGDGVDKTFVRYDLSGQRFPSYLESFATGTTIKIVSLKSIRKFSFPIPPIEEQKAIAHILGTLDDKIALNRQMNATLEWMAQAPFKSWFVGFDPVIDNALTAGNAIPEPLHARAEARMALGDKRKPLPEAIRKQFPGHFVFSEEMGCVPEGWRVKKAQAIVDRKKLSQTFTKKSVLAWVGCLLLTTCRYSTLYTWNPRRRSRVSRARKHEFHGRT